MNLYALINNHVQQNESTLKIIISLLISLLVSATEFSQNAVFAAVIANTANMMITDTDTKMMMNGFSAMSLNNKTGTMTINNAQNGMMLMLTTKRV